MNFLNESQNDKNEFGWGYRLKSHVIAINSNNKNSGNNNNAIYNFDWSVLPNIPYKVYFSFVASDNNAYVAGTSVTANIFIDFGTSGTNYYIVPNANGAFPSSYIGSLRKTISSGANYYLYSEKTTNPPIYLNGRPTNNNFQVNILSDTGAVYNIAMLGSYVLTLYFEPI
jgi:hypothetical protein